MNEIIIDSLQSATYSSDYEILRIEMQQAIQSLKDSLAASQTSATVYQKEIDASNFRTDNLWVLISAALVFIMHLGFATLESGLSRSKNTTNILFKNVIVPCLGILTFAICGYSLMFPGFDSLITDVIGFAGMGLPVSEVGEASISNTGYTFWTQFLFQGMFAATCATIVSGAVAERINLFSFIIFSTLFVGIAYPIIASWLWGNGWLQHLGFYDFAGSTLVHSVGGWAGLAAVLLLGPRFGKFEGGKIYPMPGHNMTSAVIGTFMLWFGWFGFNGGSVLSADPTAISRVLVMTSLSAAAGGLAATITIFALSKTFDLSMTLNGILAGLVGITAGADQMGILDSVVIGLIAGMLVVFAVLSFEKLRIDDPVGALSVHLVCGIWGTLAVGIFGEKAGANQFISQWIGIIAAGITSFIFSGFVFYILKITIGIRVSVEKEMEGLDTYEHGMEAYPNFIIK